MIRDKRCVRIKKENFSLYRRITMYQNRTKSPLTIRFTCPSCIGGPWGERKRAESKPRRKAKPREGGHCEGLTAAPGAAGVPGRS